MKSKAGDRQCPCCTECKDCTTGFQKVVDLKNAGLVIYRHTTETEDVNKDTGKTEFATKTTEDVFILHNTKDEDITSADVLPEIERNRLNCPRCRRMREYAQNILQKIPAINRNDVKDICEHCRMKDASCFGCEEVVKKFVANDTERTENTKERVEMWLSKIKYLLKDAQADESETDQERARTYSKLHIDQHCRRMFTQFPQLEKLERPLVYLDSIRKGKKPSSFKTKAIYKADHDHYYSDPDSEDLRAMLFSPVTKKDALKQKKNKHVELKEYVSPVSFHSEEDFVADRNESMIDDGHIRRQVFHKSRYASNEEPYPDLKPDPNQRSELDKTLSLGASKADKQNYELPVVVRKYHSEEALLTTLGGVTKDVLKQGFTYYFPKALPPDKKLKRQKSSSELIKDTQDMLLARAEQDKKRLENEEKERQAEKEKKRQEERGKKRLEEEKKLIAQEAKNKAVEEKKGLKVKTDKEKQKKIKPTPTASTGTFKSQSKEAKNKAVEEKKGLKVKTDKETQKKIKPTPTASTFTSKSQTVLEKKASKSKQESNELKPSKEQNVAKDAASTATSKSQIVSENKASKPEQESNEPKPSKVQKLDKDAASTATSKSQTVSEKKASKPKQESNEPNPSKEKKVDKNAHKTEKDEEKARMEIVKKEKDAQRKRDKEEKERLKNEKEEQLRKDKEFMQKERDKQLRKDKEFKQKDKDEQARLRAKKEAAEKKAREDPKLLMARDAGSDGDNKRDPLKSNIKKMELSKTKDLNISAVKLRQTSFDKDNLIMDLVKIRQRQNDRVMPKKIADLNLSLKQVKNHIDYNKLKRQACIVCIDSELELDAENMFFRKDEDLMADIIVGEKIIKYKSTLIENQSDQVEQLVPLVFQSTFDDATELPPVEPLGDSTILSSRENKNTKCVSFQQSLVANELYDRLSSVIQLQTNYHLSYNFI